MSKKNNIPATIEAIRTSAMAFERLEDISAGQYWRSTQDVPEMKPTYRRWVGGKVETDGRNPLSKGVTLLIKSLRYVDGGLHTVITAPHPLEEGEEVQDRRYLATEFFNLFERDLDHVDTRKAEISQIEEKISAVQTQLIEGPQDFPALSAPKNMPSVNSLIAQAGAAEEIKKNALAAVELTKRRADWVQERVTILSDHTKTLARFHQEEATAAIAAAEDTLRYAEHLQAGIETLGLYTGDGVIVNQLCAGEEADEKIPLHVYQRLLFLDEEFLINLKDGGADAGDIFEFGKALSKDPRLLTRILPMDRSVCLMRYRREDKTYFKDAEMSALARAFANAELNQKNKATFLLIRNGDNVYQVFSELTTDRAIRLFPTKAEVEGLYKRPTIFKGLDATKVTIDEIMFTDHREKHEALGLFYKRLLILMMGLNDRLNMFGDFYDRRRFPSWLSRDFQAANFRFIHDDEEALIQSRPRYYEWARSMNKYVQAGSRVIAVWEDVMDPATAPSVCSWGTGQRQDTIDFRYRPTDHISLQIVKARGEDLICAVPSAYNGWRDVKRQEMDATINVRKVISEKHVSTAKFLCLDAVKAEDLDYYINSRDQRSSYISYIDLFIAARAQLRLEEEQAEPFVKTVKASLTAASVAKRLPGKPADTAAKVDLAVADAIRLWRANRYGRNVPAPTDGEYSEALRQVGNLIYRLLGLSEFDTNKIEQLLSKDGRRPIRLVTLGNGKAYVYTTPVAGEIFDIGNFFPWVARFEVTTNKSGELYVTNRKMVLTPVTSADEYVLHAWPDDAKMPEKPLLKSGYEEAKSILDLFEESASKLSLLTDSTAFSDEAFDDLLKKHIRRSNEISPRGRRYDSSLVLPLFGLSITPQETGRSRPHFLVAQIVFSDLLWSRGTKKQRAELINWAIRSYAYPEHQLRGWKNIEFGNSNIIRFCVVEIGTMAKFATDLRNHDFLVEDIYRGEQIEHGIKPADLCAWINNRFKRRSSYKTIETRFLSGTESFIENYELVMATWSKNPPDAIDAE